MFQTFRTEAVRHRWVKEEKRLLEANSAILEINSYLIPKLRS